MGGSRSAPGSQNGIQNRNMTCADTTPLLLDERTDSSRKAELSKPRRPLKLAISHLGLSASQALYLAASHSSRQQNGLIVLGCNLPMSFSPAARTLCEFEILVVIRLQIQIRHKLYPCYLSIYRLRLLSP